MAILWDDGPFAVRAVMQRLRSSPPLAYTTMMTTLDRLHKKGLLLREKDGITFVYRSALSREDCQRSLIEKTVAERLSDSGLRSWRRSSMRRCGSMRAISMSWGV